MGAPPGGPSRQDHINQAVHNEALSRSLQAGSYTDWAVTALFYAALHLLDAVLSPQGRLKSHPKRVNFVFSSPDFSSVAAHYQELLDRSQDARYDCFRFSPPFVQNLISNDFQPFKQQARTLLRI